MTTARHGWPTDERTDRTGTSVEAVPPSTLSTLDANAWSEHLKTACVHGQLSRAVRAEVLRRTAAGQMSLRDMRMVLLVADGDQAWSPAREAVMAAAAAEPATVRNLLILHVQLEMWPPLAVVDTCDGAQARIGQPGYEVTGPARRGRTRQHAREAAQISLLAHLAGATDPLGAPAPPVPRPERTGRGGLGMDAFEALLDEDLRLPVPRPLLFNDLLGRAERGQFQHRHMYELLFTAAGEGWQRARAAMLDVVAQRSGYAAALLAMRSKALQGPLFSYDEDLDHGAEHPHVITAWIATGGGVVRGQQRRARGRRAGRHRAAVSLLAELTGLAEPEVRLPDEPEPDKPAAAPTGQPTAAGGADRKRTNALMDLNQLKMDKEISKPEWVYESVGTPQKPWFTCTGQCEVRGRAIQADGRGRNKADARMAAAEALLEQIRTHQSPVEAADTLVEPAAGAGASAATAPQAVGEGELETTPAETPVVPVQRAAPTVPLSAASAVGEAVAAGCALSLIRPAPGRPACLLLYRDDGAPMPPAALPAPMVETVRELALARGPEVRRVPVAGWALPVEVAVGSLITTDESAAGVHPSAAAWARVLRFGLELVADGLVHPAVGDDGTGVWRPGPLTGAHRTMLDGLVETLPPHAHCELLPCGDPTTLRITSPDEAVDTVLTTLANTLVATPGAPALFGTHPFLMPAQPLHPDLRQWADDLEENADLGRAPRLLLAVEAPNEADVDAQQLRATLLAHRDDTAPPVPARALWSEPATGTVVLRRRIQRALRRSATVWSAAERLAAQPEPAGMRLSVAEVAQLAELGADGVPGLQVRWPAGLIDALTTRTVVGARSATGDTRLGLAQLLDFSWQIALNGQPLTEAEMDALAEAARPLLRLRDTWVLLDPTTARRAAHRQLASLTGIDALGAALSGTITVDGQPYPCEAAGQLADLITALRTSTSDAGLVPVPDGLRAQLRGYQHRGLTWLARLTDLGFGAVLADDMGLGKTLTTISLILHRKQTGARTPTLVIARASLVTNWMRELAKFAPGLKTIAYHGTGRTLAEATGTTVVVTTYGVLQRDAELLAATQWDMVVADEAQSVKNPDSLAAQALRTLTCAVPLAMTGTPVENRLEELWAIMDWANPGLLGTRTTFRTRYGRDAERDTTGETARLLGRLISPFLLRRRKSDPGIAPELPDKIHVQRIVQLTREQAALYEAAVRETLDAVRHSTGIARHGLVVKLITALRQVCNHPAHYLKETFDPDAAPGAFAARSAKLAVLDELLDQIATLGESALIFTSYVEMGRLLQAHLSAHGRRPEFVHGGTPVRTRQRLVDAFQAGDTPVLILSVKAAGVGLNLTRATHVIHYDQQWNPAIEDQATDRAHRIGQHRQVHVHQLINDATLEDRIAALLVHKRGLSDAVLAGGEKALADLDDQELAQLVSLGSHP
ncbi:DEAD/DEAH box helicase [Streptomyces sp. SAI-090]|uniref:DEAD/DEAH box helicase n=1 Tax=Streptomyces sp. SAI-090 TaxID=2940545 RepID=UPI002475D8B5|nr:DEAD/DEAH box helicase [Streptomyces sp. SAI-090]